MTDHPPDSRWRRPAFAGILLITVFLGSRGLFDESSAKLGVDMARYVMNGVFLHDLIADGGAWSKNELVNYAERYYVRYPALSLGHHPPLPYIALVPFYAVFGINLFAAKLAALAWFVLAAWGMYALTRRLFDWRVASWATVLLVTNPFVLRFGQYVLSEIPMLTLVLWSVNALLRYCDTRRPAQLLWFVMLAAASLYAKQLALFMAPVYLAILFTGIGWRGLFSRRVLLIGGVGVLVVAPLVVMTMGLSPTTVGMAMWNITHLGEDRGMALVEILQTIVRNHLSLPLLLMTIAGAVVLVARRDWRAIVAFTWVASIMGGSAVFAGRVEPARYALGAVPAYLLMAGNLVNWTSAAARAAATVALSATLLWQAWLIRDVRPTGAGGYETVAQYVIEHSTQPAVMFDTAVDSGYFVFFVRKHDPAGRLLLLRADKMMSTPPVDRFGPGDKIKTVEEIYALLKKFGVQFVVVESRAEGASIVKRFHEELRSDRFIERLRVPIRSRELVVKGVDLVVYEFKDAQPADPNAVLDIDLPLGEREIKLRMRDLIGTGAR